MYSYELEEYLKQHNYRLDVIGLTFIQNRKYNPQVSTVKYSPYGDYFELWTTDGWYFKFYPIPYSEFINNFNEVSRKDMNLMQGDHYRFYAALDGPWENILTSPDVQKIFNIMDEYILHGNHQRASYILVWNVDRGDTPAFVGFGDPRPYLEFKEEHLLELKRRNELKQTQSPKLIRKKEV